MFGSNSGRHCRGVSTDCISKLWYLKPLELYRTFKPFHINLPVSALPPGCQSNEVSEEVGDIKIENARGREEEFKLDRNGFQWFKVGPDGRGDFAKFNGLEYEAYADPEAIRSKYYPAVENFVCKALGARKVKAFNHEVRRREQQFPVLPRGTGIASQPVQGVHVDFTPRWAEERLQMIMPEQEALDFLRYRWQVLTVWRPLVGPVQDWPLALCDYTSLRPMRDLIPSDNIYPHMVSETYNVFYNKDHRWYYLGNMTADEAVILKNFDSKDVKGTARVCAHAAFNNTTAPKGARPRESIECVLFVSCSEEHSASTQEREELP